VILKPAFGTCAHVYLFDLYPLLRLFFYFPSLPTKLLYNATTHSFFDLHNTRFSFTNVYYLVHLFIRLHHTERQQIKFTQLVKMQFSATIAVLLSLAHLIDGALIPAVKLRALNGPDSSVHEGSSTGYNWGNWGSSSGHEVMITKTDYNNVVVPCETSTTSPVADV
jgi:hypothetical protein